MPWDAQTIGKHNKSLRGGGAKAGHTADIANAVLKSSGDEGMALAVANKWAKKHRDAGGGVFGGIGRQRDREYMLPGHPPPPPHSPMNDPDYEYYWNKQPEYDPPEDDTLLGPMRQARRDVGGYTPDTGALTPSAATMNPMAQSYMQRFATMPTEKLQELAVRMGAGSPVGQMAQRMMMQRHFMAGTPQGQPTQPGQAYGTQLGQATPAAGTVPQQNMPQQQAQPQGFAFGGPQTGISMSQATPPWSRRYPQPSVPGMGTSGFLHSAIPGRTDKINANPVANSFVLPADVVSGLGEGNSLAGAHALKMALSTGPRGVDMPRGGRGLGMPRFKSASGGATTRGGATESVPILAAGGEYVLTPEEVADIGNGDVKRGHKILEAFVVKVRAALIKELKGLKGPVKSR